MSWGLSQDQGLGLAESCLSGCRRSGSLCDWLSHRRNTLARLPRPTLGLSGATLGPDVTSGPHAVLARLRNSRVPPRHWRG